jgi:hypothetical protein
VVEVPHRLVSMDDESEGYFAQLCGPPGSLRQPPNFQE